MIKNCKLAVKTQKALIGYFVANCSARKAAVLVGVNRNTATLYFRKLREELLRWANLDSLLDDVVEVDECYIGQKQSGKRGRSPTGKIILVGAKQRNGKVVIQNVQDVTAETLKQFICKNIKVSSTVCTDGFRSYNFLTDAGYAHNVVNHSAEYVVEHDPSTHTNGIENVWKQMRRMTAVYNGIRRNTHLFLAEILFRLNTPSVLEQRNLLYKWRLAS